MIAYSITSNALYGMSYANDKIIENKETHPLMMQLDIIMRCGVLVIKRDIAAGIIKLDDIVKVPTAAIEVAIHAPSIMFKNKNILSVFIPSTIAISLLKIDNTICEKYIPNHIKLMKATIIIDIKSEN
jgi:hypothetical protein